MGSPTETIMKSARFLSRKRAHRDVFRSGDLAVHSCAMAQGRLMEAGSQQLSWYSRLHLWHIYRAARGFTAGLFGKFENWYRFFVAQIREQNPPPSKRRRTSTSNHDQILRGAIHRPEEQKNNEPLERASKQGLSSVDIQHVAVPAANHVITPTTTIDTKCYLPKPKPRPKKSLSQILLERRQSQHRIFSTPPPRDPTRERNDSHHPSSTSKNSSHEESLNANGFAYINNRPSILIDNSKIPRHLETNGDGDLTAPSQPSVSVPNAATQSNPEKVVSTHTSSSNLGLESPRKSKAQVGANNSKTFEELQEYIEFLHSIRSKDGIPQTLDYAKEERDKIIIRKSSKIPTLPSSDLEIVKKALVQTSSKTPLVSKFSIDIHSRDIITLASPNWLNDEVVNFYASLITDRSKSSSDMPKVHMFNTFFYPTLRRSGYKGIKKWTKRAKVDFMDMDFIIVPVHLSVHWCLSVINFRDKRFEYWDSLGGGGNEVFESLRDYVKEESAGEIDLSQWTDYYPKNNPKQNNGYDCGVFTCKTAECISRGALMNFDQSDMMNIRNWMVKEILDGRLQQASA
ncbi:Ubiquitin-like-specific protease 1 [Neolecta irregularis DAH-3]|uniref:Ubiquitin-like-specific protease 1 n=1 Tax=Neolecta irregularis (strain DAH-3) TaxID=1198029 RepID=A0A1U7LRT9_NEOID|nr:Ubiquitin-like-specific protease 1 [Neolecta irregularis DAH-3]|eukprot:OLL25386.1 Ubiquitin-like-specific protease 1 [Neolecta irregularis DAH-3]